MKRTSTKAAIGDNQTRHRTRLEGPDCVPGTHEARILQKSLLTYIAEDPSLAACGPSPFEKLVVFHDGQRWVAEAEAVVEEQR